MLKEEQEDITQEMRLDRKEDNPLQLSRIIMLLSSIVVSNFVDEFVRTLFIDYLR
jgi:hypothetical protein